MIKYSVSFAKLIAEYLPPKKRTDNRIAFIFRLSSWLRKVHAEFIVLQQKLEAQSRVTSQVIIFEDYLVQQFGLGITITVNEVNANEGFVADEDDDDFGFLISHEDDDFGGSYISDEDTLEFFNFSVNVPIAINADLDQMAAIINKYKVTGSTYQIIES